VSSEDPEYQSKLIRYLSETDDITDVDFILTLHCYEVDEKLNVKEINLGIGGASYLFIELIGCLLLVAIGSHEYPKPKSPAS